MTSLELLSRAARDASPVNGGLFSIGAGRAPRFLSGLRKLLLKGDKLSFGSPMRLALTPQGDMRDRSLAGFFVAKTVHRLGNRRSADLYIADRSNLCGIRLNTSQFSAYALLARSNERAVFACRDVTAPDGGVDIFGLKLLLGRHLTSLLG
jgi:hypothetical protein